jgi:hypothetical protein
MATSALVLMSLLSNNNVMRNLKSTSSRKIISALLVLLSFGVSIQAQNLPINQKPSAKSSKDYLNLLKETLPM